MVQQVIPQIAQQVILQVARQGIPQPVQHVLQDANGNGVTVTETTNGDYYYMDDNGTGYIDNGDGTWTDENGNSYTE